MRWKQFFTPVKSFNSDETRNYLADKIAEDITILDVRQPGEYESGHIPGAKLIPLPELTDRLDEIDPSKPTVVYCATGGRSRVAAQMLTEKGFDSIVNLSGGIRGWSGNTAIGDETLGLELFTGSETPEETLKAAYFLEAGLSEFYLSMIPRISSPEAKRLFQKLSEIEVKHQDRIFSEHQKITGHTENREKFDQAAEGQPVEGGLTTEEYVDRFKPDWNSPGDIVGLAMSIEAQAFDLYQRAAARSPDPRNREVLLQIANEEKTHLVLLGKLMESL